MAYLYLDFHYSLENNRLIEVDIEIETTNYFDPSIDTFNINQNGYTPMKGDKLYFLPGVNIPRIKLKDLATKFGIRTVRDVSEANVIFGSSKTKDKMTGYTWKYKIPTTIVQLFFETYKNDMDDYQYSKLENALEFYTEEYILTDWSTARTFTDNDLPQWNSYSQQPQFLSFNSSRNTSSEHVHEVNKDYIHLYDLIKGKEIIDESCLLDQLNGDDAVIIDADMFTQLTTMFDSSDDDNHILAMEIMANSKYKESLLYIEMIFKNHAYTIGQSNTKNHVNFKSLLSYLGKNNRYIDTSLDDIMDSLISKKVLTKDKVDILLENYGEEIKNRGDSTYFKVQTITVNEDTLSLLNENYNYKVIEDYEPSIVNNLEEEKLDEVIEDELINEIVNEPIEIEIIIQDDEIEEEAAVQTESKTTANDTDIDWF
jgi:hypothetical protein